MLMKKTIICFRMVRDFSLELQEVGIGKVNILYLLIHQRTCYIFLLQFIFVTLQVGV